MLKPGRSGPEGTGEAHTESNSNSTQVKCSRSNRRRGAGSASIPWKAEGGEEEQGARPAQTGEQPGSAAGVGSWGRQVSCPDL